MAVSFTSVCNAQNIERLSEQEINACETPHSVAYNFVMSIINQDYTKMESLMTSEYLNEMKEGLKKEGITWAKLFSSEYVHDIVEMRPVIKIGYSVVITDFYVTDTDKFYGMYGEKSPYSGMPAFSVFFNCADSQDNIYFGDYDTTARILLVEKNGKWQVFAFK